MPRLLETSDGLEIYHLRISRHPKSFFSYFFKRIVERFNSGFSISKLGTGGYVLTDDTCHKYALEVGYLHLEVLRNCDIIVSSNYYDFVCECVSEARSFFTMTGDRGATKGSIKIRTCTLIGLKLA